MATQFLHKALSELGLVSLWTCSTNVKLLCAQRFVRLMAYGGSTLILVAYLAELNISTEMIGLFMTLTLWGDVGISFILTLFADALGRRTILAIGAAMMVGSGVVFALFGNYWVLLLAAIFGVISPSGNEIGPFRAIEESILAHLTPAASRGDIYAWYSLLGTAGTALGMMICGWSIHYMRVELEWNSLQVYRATFWGYSLLGAIKLCLTLALSNAVEAEKKKEHPPDPETAPLLSDGNADSKPSNSRFRSLLPDISPESRVIVLQLCLLFALDAFASGLAPMSWVTFFFRTKFAVSEGKLGSIFFTTSVIAALSMLVAASLAKRIGNVKTMVFTHLPSAIFLALIPIPNSLPFALLFLILRSCTQSMDTAPRSAFLAAVILPNERTAIMGLMNVVKTSALSLGPTITGLLANRGLFWVSFVMAGSLKATYDLGMLAVFAGYKTREDLDEEAIVAQQNEQLRESEDPNER